MNRLKNLIINSPPFYFFFFNFSPLVNESIEKMESHHFIFFFNFLRLVNESIEKIESHYGIELRFSRTPFHHFILFFFQFFATGKKLVTQ